MYRLLGHVLVAAVSLSAVLAAAPPVGAAAPDRSVMDDHQLWAQYSTLPAGQAGTGDYVQVWAETMLFTHDGETTTAMQMLNIAVYEGTINEIGDASTIWAGEYTGPDRHVEFGPRDVTAEGTLTWHCNVGACPVMPATVHVSVAARAAGAPTVQVFNESGYDWMTHQVIQRHDITITLDSGGAIGLHPLIYGALVHNTAIHLSKSS